MGLGSLPLSFCHTVPFKPCRKFDAFHGWSRHRFPAPSIIFNDGVGSGAREKMYKWSVVHCTTCTRIGNVWSKWREGMNCPHEQDGARAERTPHAVDAVSLISTMQSVSSHLISSQTTRSARSDVPLSHC